MFALVLEKMARDDVIEDGVAQKLQALVTVRDVVVVVRGVGESLSNKARATRSRLKSADDQVY